MSLATCFRLDFLLPLVENMRDTERKSKSPTDKKNKSPVEKISSSKLSKSPEDVNSKHFSEIKKAIPISRNNNKRKELFSTSEESKPKKQKNVSTPIENILGNSKARTVSPESKNSKDIKMKSSNVDDKQMIPTKFTITSLLDTNQPPIILSHLDTNQPQSLLSHPATSQLDEDYD